MSGNLASEIQLNKLGWLVGVGIALAALGLYTSTLAPSVLEADAGEFQFVPWLPGIAHPTGYPLYVLVGWLWTHLFRVGEVAWRMNLLSAILAAVAVGMTYALARQLLDRALPDAPTLARRITGAVVAATFAVTHTFWSQAIIAEVYALHTLFVALILWLALKYRNQNNPRNPDHWSGKLLAFTIGLGLTHHITTILLFPGLLLFLWTIHGSFMTEERGYSFKRLGAWKGPITYGVLLVAPLLLYLYLPLIAPSTPYAELSLSRTQTLTLYDTSLQGFLEHVAGAVFAGQLQPSAVGVERFFLIWQLLQQQVGWAGAILAGFGVIFLWRRRQKDLLILTAVTFMSFIIFNLIYFIGDVFVLFIPAWLIVCLWLGIGGLGLAQGITANFVRKKMDPNQYVVFERMQEQLGQRTYRVLVSTLSLFFFVLPLTLTATQFSKVDQSHNLAAGIHWQKVLAEPIPTSAILLSNDRNEIMPMWYYQYVEGRRPDLLGLFPLIVPELEYANIGRVLDQALASGRPVYFIKPMNELGLKVDIVPEGTLFRATEHNSPPYYPTNVTLPEISVPLSNGNNTEETVRLMGYDLSSAKITPGDEITVTLHWQVVKELAIDYTSYVHLITEDGLGITQSDHRPGGDFYPSSYWKVDEILRDRHTLPIPANAPTGKYRLRVGMYYQPEPGVIEGMGDGIEIDTIAIWIAVDDNTKQS